MDLAGTAAFFIFAFTSVFVIVNPVGGIVTFMSLTGGMDDAERRAVARRSVSIACALALIFALSGEFVLELFHITVDSLRVAGGLLLFIVAIDMMHARISRESVTPEEMREAERKEDVSVFPLATPLLTGPGAITTVIVVMKTGKSIELKAATIAAVLLTFGISYAMFRSAARIHRIIGVTVSMVITRIMGLLLGAIAVDFIAGGSWNIYMALRG